MDLRVNGNNVFIRRRLDDQFRASIGKLNGLWFRFGFRFHAYTLAHSVGRVNKKIEQLNFLFVKLYYATALSKSNAGPLMTLSFLSRPSLSQIQPSLT